MNGLEAFKKLREYINIEHRKIANVDVETIESYPLDKIERELKVNQILKEKKVDLSIINWLLAEQFKQTPIEKKVSFYNFKMGYKKGEMLDEEEFTQIAELLKEE